MNDESLEQIERQIAAAHKLGSPHELRSKVLAETQRELRAARWDRRLARAALLLFVFGVGMNAALGWRPEGSIQTRIAHSTGRESRPSLVETATVIAEATDPTTARWFAKQLAAMRGRELTSDEAAAIEEAVRRPAAHSVPGNRG